MALKYVRQFDGIPHRNRLQRHSEADFLLFLAGFWPKKEVHLIKIHIFAQYTVNKSTIIFSRFMNIRLQDSITAVQPFKTVEPKDAYTSPRVESVTIQYAILQQGGSVDPFNPEQ